MTVDIWNQDEGDCRLRIRSRDDGLIVLYIPCSSTISTGNINPNKYDGFNDIRDSPYYIHYRTFYSIIASQGIAYGWKLSTTYDNEDYIGQFDGTARLHTLNSCKNIVPNHGWGTLIYLDSFSVDLESSPNWKDLCIPDRDYYLKVEFEGTLIYEYYSSGPPGIIYRLDQPPPPEPPPSTGLNCGDCEINCDYVYSELVEIKNTLRNIK
jgi:hypothetical protein